MMDVPPFYYAETSVVAASSTVVPLTNKTTEHVSAIGLIGDLASNLATSSGRHKGF